MTNQAMRDGEAARVNPPTQYDPDERCDGGNHDLYEPVTRFTEGYVSGGKEHEKYRYYWCPECRYKFTTNREDHAVSIGRNYWELETVDRCDCGYFKSCRCPDER